MRTGNIRLNSFCILSLSTNIPTHALCAHKTLHEARTEEFPTSRKNVVTSDLIQLHQRKPFRPMSKEDFSKEKKHESLALLMLRKKK